MTWQPTDQERTVLHYTGKLLVLMAGVATFGVLSSISLWRLGWIAPNSRFSAVLFGVPLLAFYTATVTMVLRLAGGPAFSEGFEVGVPSFPVLVYGKGGVLRPRFRLRFLYLPQTFALVRIIK